MRFRFLSLNDVVPLAQRGLVWQLARRDVQARYRGSMLGLAWALMTPLLMLGVYTFVFRQVLKARWPGVAGTADAGAMDFALRIYAGLIVFNLFAELVSRAPALITSQPNMVKKVVFPLQVLPWVAVMAAMFQVALNVLVLVAAVWLLGPGLSPTVVAMPLVVLAMCPFLLGLGWWLGSLGVFLRDIGQATGMVVSLLMFLSPIFYPASALPEQFQAFLWLNPLALPIEELRAVALDGRWPHWGPLALYALAGSVFAVLGARWFAATRHGFADVL